MARKGMPGIITVGNRREWPRETWGWLDWQREDELQAQARWQGDQSVGRRPTTAANPSQLTSPGPTPAFLSRATGA